MAVRYRKSAIAIFDTTPEQLFRYMSAGNHPHLAFKSHTGLPALTAMS